MLDYRCPYCYSPLTDDDTARDGEALFCTDCGHRVEYFDALETASEELVSYTPRSRLRAYESSEEIMS